MFLFASRGNMGSPVSQPRVQVLSLPWDVASASSPESG